MFVLQVTVGAMTFNVKQQRGVRKKIAPVVLSLDQDASLDSVVKRARDILFPEAEDKEMQQFYLGNNDGYKIEGTSHGLPLTIGEYFKLHGLYPSKTRLYCVEVRQLFLSCIGATVSLSLCIHCRIQQCPFIKLSLK